MRTAPTAVRAANPLAARARFGIGIACFSGIWMLLFLATWATLVPLVQGWSPVAVLSGSMGPAIAAGDVVLTEPPQLDQLGPGVVIAFDTPGADGMTTHRIVDLTPSGDLVTQGDANMLADSTPVRPESVRGVGRILVPYIGRPFLWVDEGRWLSLTLVAGAVAGALWACRWALLPRFDPWRLLDSEPVVASPPASRRPVDTGVAVLVLVAAVTAVLGGTSRAAFADTTTTGGSSVTVDTLAPPTAVSPTSGSSATLDWTATVDTYALGHRILRASSPGGPYSAVADVAPRTTTTYIDSPASGTYYYVIRAYTALWESIDSDEVSATVSAGGGSIAFDTASSTQGDGPTLSVSHTVESGSNRILIVGVASEREPVLSATYAGQSLTKIGAQDDPDDESRAELWYLLNPPVGTANVVVTLSGSRETVIGATSWTGVDQTTPLGTLSSANGNSSTASVTVSSATGDVVVDVAANINAGSLTLGPGQTQYWNRNQKDVTGGHSSETGATSVTMSWTMPSDFWAIVAVPLKPAP